jgi:hypothetical protein
MTKETRNLSNERKIQNASRRDNKNGKMKDMLENNGFVTKEWSPVSAGGRVQSKQFDFFGQSYKSQN